MPLHPAWVKNISRRVLWGALEKDISREERDSMHRFFEGACAYCGTELTSRWHADHLLAVDQGGFNHIGNRVPACPKCNEQEKQEREWLEFLAFKCSGGTSMFERRKGKIERWRDSHLPDEPPVTEAQRAVWKEEVESVAKAIDKAWANLKDIKS